MGQDPVHGLISDTDALIALASTELWEEVANNVGISTTNACLSELYDHSRRNDTFVNVGARRARLASSAKKAIESIKDDSTSISRHIVGGCRNGEHSIAKLINDNLDEVEGILMMDDGSNDDLEIGGRELVKAHVELEDHDISFTSPAFPLAVLYINSIIEKSDFCEETDQIIRHEDWTSYSAVKRMWEGIPVDCGRYVPTEHLH